MTPVAPGSAGRPGSPIPLSLADRSNLRIERPETPAHVAGLCLVEAGPLLGEDGEPDLAAIRRRLERRLSRAPELRRVVCRPPPLCGPAMWVDAPDFSIDHHVRAARIDAPGDETSLLRTAELLLRPLLDRSRPLWELWILTGLADGRLGVLFKVHHAVADGLAAIALLASLLDIERDAADPPAEAWRPAPAPSAPALLADNVRRRATAAARTLGHPARLARWVAAAVDDTGVMLRSVSAAPRLSLNRLPGRSRRLRAVHLDLERARAVAHAHQAKVNDVLLAVVAGGLGELLRARGELTAGLELQASVPMALRPSSASRRLGNAVGVIVVPLPVSEPDAARRLERIARATRAAKAGQQPAVVQDVIGGLAALGLMLPLARCQRLVNTFVTNVPGPRDPLFFLGARIEAVLPVVGLAGNVTVVFAALSYCGQLEVVVVADEAACPDGDVLVAGTVRGWSELAAGLRARRATSPATPAAEQPDQRATTTGQ